MEYMFVVLSVSSLRVVLRIISHASILKPCAFIAADYVLLGRLAKHLNADKHLLVRSRRITITFVTSDITTFLIQASYPNWFIHRS